MKALSKVTHLVHIGYDGLRQPDFESRVSKYLESTADEAEHILNFVDEASYSVEDIKLMEQNYFAEALRMCLGMQHARSLGGSSEVPEEIFMKQLQWIPNQLLVAIKEILGNDWQALAQKLPAFEEWRDTRKPLGSYLSGREDIGELELPQDIKFQLENQDGILKRIKTHEFDTILQKLQKQFGGKNIFKFHSANTPRNDRVLNPERRKKIMQRAQELFGDQRIVFSAMRDGDDLKLIHALLGDDWSSEVADYWDEIHQEHGIGYEVSDYAYGNADERLLKQNQEITLDRYHRFKYDTFMQLADKGFVIDDATQHILGGEYFQRCVSAWGGILNSYGIPENKRTIEKTLSLSHRDDM